VKTMDISKAIQIAVKTGKVLFGFKESLEALRGGRAKLIIIAKNIPKDREKTVQQYAKISRTPILQYDGSSLGLGSVCEKPFPVSVLAIRDPGDSEILKMVKSKK